MNTGNNFIGLLKDFNLRRFTNSMTIITSAGSKVYISLAASVRLKFNRNFDYTAFIRCNISKFQCKHLTFETPLVI